MKKIFKTVLVIIFIGALLVFLQSRNSKDKTTPEIEIIDKETKIVDKIDNAQKEDETKDELSSKIPEITEWSGPDPYPALDWSGALPELKTAVNEFEKEWGKPLHIRQVYRSALYGKHMRSVWEVWRYINGKSYTHGYRCDEITHINPKNIGTLNQNQKDYINKEVTKHSFLGGDTPPGCVSDHAKGIAVDITPPTDPIEYDKFINTAYKVGLCHYIKGDEPHFGLTAQLSAGTDCFVK
jgi:hypothetical protein